MANMLGRVVTIAVSVIASQGMFGAAINGFFPTATKISFGFFSVGGVVTAAIGVWFGDWLATKQFKF